MEALLGAQPAAEPTLLGREARCYRPKRETLGSWVSMETMDHAATASGTTLAHWILHSNIKYLLDQPLFRLFPSHVLWTTDPSKQGFCLCCLTVCSEWSWQVGGVSCPPPNIRRGDTGTAKDTESLSSLVVRLCPGDRSGKISVF